MDISSVASKSVATASGDGAPVLPQATPATPSSATPKTAAVGVSDQAPSPERVAQAVKQVNDSFAQSGQNLSASIEKDQATGINVVKVRDKVTKEEISQYPSKAIVAIAEALQQSQEAKGKLLSVRA